MKKIKDIFGFGRRGWPGSLAPEVPPVPRLDVAEARGEIEALLRTARERLPESLLEPLPIDETLGVPAWRDFESEIWDIGETIRQVLLKVPRLRADKALQTCILEVACDRRAHRGRQSFVMLLGYRSCAEHASSIADHLDDPFVDGHVVDTLYKMRAPGFSDGVRPLLRDEMAWVRNCAKRYLAWDGARTFDESAHIESDRASECRSERLSRRDMHSDYHVPTPSEPVEH